MNRTIGINNEIQTKTSNGFNGREDFINYVDLLSVVSNRVNLSEYIKLLEDTTGRTDFLNFVKALSENLGRRFDFLEYIRVLARGTERYTFLAFVESFSKIKGGRSNFLEYINTLSNAPGRSDFLEFVSLLSKITNNSNFMELIKSLFEEFNIDNLIDLFAELANLNSTKNFVDSTQIDISLFCNLAQFEDNAEMAEELGLLTELVLEEIVALIKDGLSPEEAIKKVLISLLKEPESTIENMPEIPNDLNIDKKLPTELIYMLGQILGKEVSLIIKDLLLKGLTLEETLNTLLGNVKEKKAKEAKQMFIVPISMIAS